MRHLTVSRQQLLVPPTFPRIISPLMHRALTPQHGPLRNTQGSKGNAFGGADITSLPVVTRTGTGPPMAQHLEGMLSTIQRLGLQRAGRGGHVLSEWNIGREDAEEMAEHLAEMLSGSRGSPPCETDDT